MFPLGGKVEKGKMAGEEGVAIARNEHAEAVSGDNVGEFGRVGDGVGGRDVHGLIEKSGGAKIHGNFTC